MTRLRVAIHDHADQWAEDFSLEAPDICSALTIADINVVEGNAEIWDGDRRLARLAKHGGSYATFWQVG